MREHKRPHMLIIEWKDLDSIIKHRITLLGQEFGKYPGDMQHRLDELLHIRDEIKGKAKEITKGIE